MTLAIVTQNWWPGTLQPGLYGAINAAARVRRAGWQYCKAQLWCAYLG
jgi:hypothetical protein